MMTDGQTQQERALSLLNRQGMARLSELAKEGITAATIARMREKGLILQLSRGLYQLPMPAAMQTTPLPKRRSSCRRASCA